MDEIVLWEHTGKLADDMPIEEVNAFFRDYVKKYGRLLLFIPNDSIELKQLMREKFLKFCRNF